MKLRGIDYQTRLPVEVQIVNGAIDAKTPIEAGEREALPYIAPGLVELQINGCFGHNFNSHPIMPETVHRAARYLWSEGVTSFYPTVTTHGNEEILSSMKTIAAACLADEQTREGVRGIHLEGPFISPEDGARGAHSLQYVTKPDWEQFQRWQDAANGMIKILTLSPEWPEACNFIEKCSATGVIVSIGHTSASPEQIREAVAAGATMSTHLGNGTHVMLPRHPNYLWEQLAADELWISMIPDGFHLPDSVLKVFMKAKGDKALFVSDAVYLSGMPEGEYDTHIGNQVVLERSGRLSTKANPKILAGSAQLLPWGIARMIRSGLCTVEDAWNRASVFPAKLMGLPEQEGLSVGAPADLVCFHMNETCSIAIEGVYKKGRQVWSPASIA